MSQQLRVQEWMEGDDFNTEAVMNICGEYANALALSMDTKFIFLKECAEVSGFKCLFLNGNDKLGIQSQNLNSLLLLVELTCTISSDIHLFLTFSFVLG